MKSLRSYAETESLVEQAILNCMSEQKKLLTHDLKSELLESAVLISDLVVKTQTYLSMGVDKYNLLDEIIKDAENIECAIDAVSLNRWRAILINISPAFLRIKRSFSEPPAFEAGHELRNHYHKIRIQLLEQIRGLRLLQNSSDIGEESERIWQEFLQKHLGSEYLVLRGGHIIDNNGWKSSNQYDILVVPADATVITPSNSSDGKVNVFLDELLAVAMVSITYDKQKFRKDWESLQTIPKHKEKSKDHPQLRNHAWPLCYLLGGRSLPLSDLVKEWDACVNDLGVAKPPELFISLDSGVIAPHSMSWPKPSPCCLSSDPGQQYIFEDLRAGLGLGWMLLQIKGRLAAIRKQSLNAIVRKTTFFNHASLKEGMPVSGLSRFPSHSFVAYAEIAGNLKWGTLSCHPHNQLLCNTIHISINEDQRRNELRYHWCKTREESESRKFFSESREYRFFRLHAYKVVNNIVALEEWLRPSSDKETMWRKVIVLIDIYTGVDLTTISRAELADVEEFK